MSLQIGVRLIVKLLLPLVSLVTRVSTLFINLETRLLDTRLSIERDMRCSAR